MIDQDRIDLVLACIQQDITERTAHIFPDKVRISLIAEVQDSVKWALGPGGTEYIERMKIKL